MGKEGRKSRKEWLLTSSLGHPVVGADLVSARYYGRNLTKTWSFYDHVIRNQKDLLRIQEYILNNPLQWALDDENPDRLILRADTRSAPTKINRGTQMFNFYA